MMLLHSHGKNSDFLPMIYLLVLLSDADTPADVFTVLLNERRNPEDTNEVVLITNSNEQVASTRRLLSGPEWVQLAQGTIMNP
jgi:hypothetical protein